jgi:hypothetical protein
MLTLQMHNRTAWSDYFTGSAATTYNSETYGARRTLSGTSVHVLNCLFRSITSSTSDGGAFYCTSVTYLLVESTSFFTCKTSSDEGGAIYFSNGNGQCVLHEVCGYDCCSTYTSSSWGQFSYITVNNAISSKNYVNYSSISQCVNTNGYQTLRLDCGKALFPSINISMNKCLNRAGILCNPFSDSNVVTCSFSFSTFTYNIASGCTCISLNTNYANYEIKSCNILSNTQGSLSSEGTIKTYGNLNIEDSCLLENQANYIFYQPYDYSTITISNCAIDSASSNRNINIEKTVTKSFILALNHMSTRNCHAEYDSIGTLTPIIQTSSTSNSQKHCCTCGKMFYNPQQGNFALLSSLFIFNFIHYGTFVDPFY